MKTFRRFAWALIACIFFAQSLFGAGVAVTKEQRFHSDRSAKPFVFTSVRDYGRHILFETGLKTFSIERTIFIEFIEVPASIPDDITNPDQLISIRKEAEKIRAFVDRFPLSEPLLRQNLEALQQTISSYESGLVRYQKKWLPLAEFEVIKQQLAFAAASSESEERARIAQKERLAEEAKKIADARMEELAHPELTAEKELQKYSVIDVEYRLRERVGDGAFIEYRNSEGAPDVVYLEDYSTSGIVGGSSHRGNLYYGGSYRSFRPSDGGRAVKSFYRTREFALSRLSAKNAAVAGDKPKSDARPGISDSDYLAGSGPVWVSGYFKSDGTWVEGHFRNAPGQGPAVTSTPRYTPSAATSGSSGGSVRVKGYYRKNGTYVRPHTRRR